MHGGEGEAMECVFLALLWLVEMSVSHTVQALARMCNYSVCVWKTQQKKVLKRPKSFYKIPSASESFHWILKESIRFSQVPQGSTWLHRGSIEVPQGTLVFHEVPSGFLIHHENPIGITLFYKGLRGSSMFELLFFNKKGSTKFHNIL